MTQTYGGKEQGTLEARVAKLEALVAQQGRTIVGLQNELIRAGRYTNPNLNSHIAGIQVLLTKAGEYKGRAAKTRNG